MSLDAGKLRHRVRFERLVNTRDSEGVLQPEWQTAFTTMAAIEPLSAREFIQAAAGQSEVTGRLTIRYRDGITAAMRIVHVKRGTVYNIQGLLPDKESGIEYLTIPVSTGVGSGQ